MASRRSLAAALHRAPRTRHPHHARARASQNLLRDHALRARRPPHARSKTRHCEHNAQRSCAFIAQHHCAAGTHDARAVLATRRVGRVEQYRSNPAHATHRIAPPRPRARCTYCHTTSFATLLVHMLCCNHMPCTHACARSRTLAPRPQRRPHVTRMLPRAAYAGRAAVLRGGYLPAGSAPTSGYNY